jgi:hypothetical protein
VNDLRFLPKASPWGKTGAINRSTAKGIPSGHSSVNDFAFLRTAKVNGNSILAKTAFEFVLIAR